MKYHGFDSLLRALSLFYLSMIASLIFSCGHHETIEEAVGNVLPLPDSSCMGYFGQPNEKSGLTEAQCASTCQCEQSSYQWSDAPFSSVLFGFHHQNEPEPLSEDPYLSNVQISQGEELACVITVNWLDNSYQLETLRLEDAPPEQITHIGPCGACSSMRDLQVYVENTDLTEPVRRCGIKGISNEAEGLNCLNRHSAHHLTPYWDLT